MSARARGPGDTPVGWLAALVVLLSLPAQGAIQVLCHPEGAPRNPTQIVRVNDTEYRILAGGEPDETYFSLPVARVELMCRNEGARSQALTLHLDLSGLGTRTNATDSPWAAMPKRDYLFVQRPGEDWAQLRGRINGWICSVAFSIPPSDTKLGLSPWYT